jgi:hypothetical protein
MLDQSLLQSHFIGRDGFRWWIGQVPPVEVWQEQADKSGWGLRVKVRILGYHSIDTSDLSNEELPWALVMLPTTAGSGAAFYGTNPKISQGDMVIGFFLDGDNAQIPVIMGLLGKTNEWGDSGYQNPFVPFTGYTKNISKSDISMRGLPTGLPTNEDTIRSQGVHPAVDPKNGPTTSSAIGTKVVLANTCDNTTQPVIKSEIDNLLKWIQEKQAKIGEYNLKVRNAAEVIKGSLGWVINEIFKRLELFLVGDEKKPGIIPRGIQALYTAVYGATYAATQNPAIAHEAGCKAENACVVPVQILEKAIVCVKNAVLDGLTGFIVEILNSLIQNVKSFVTCAAEQFIGVTLNAVVDQVSAGLTSALDGILGILGVAFNVASFLRGGLSGLFGLLDCGQSNTKCDGTKEWIIGVGPVNPQSTNLQNIMDAVNNTASLVDAVVQGAEGVSQSFQNSVDAINSAVDILNGNSSLTFGGDITSCYTGTPTSCGPATLKIFGGGGINGDAAPIFGSIIQSTSLYQNVFQTSSIIGATITNAGSGYRFPPFVEITDNCGLGYGAKARSVINDKGELEAIYIVSPGVGYPIGDQEPSGVTDTVIQSSGLNYSTGDTASDDFGNEYDLTIEDGRVISAKPINSVEVAGLPRITVNSETGFGAVISPVFGTIFPATKFQTQVDCPI